jgi:hypothetical protein
MRSRSVKPGAGASAFVGFADVGAAGSFLLPSPSASSLLGTAMENSNPAPTSQEKISFCPNLRIFRSYTRLQRQDCITEIRLDAEHIHPCFTPFLLTAGQTAKSSEAHAKRQSIRKTDIESN